LPVFDALQALLWGGGYIGELSAVGTFRVDTARGRRVLSCTSSRECTLDLSRALPSLSAGYCARCVTSLFRCPVVAFPLFGLLRVVEGDESVVFGGGHIRRRDVLHREAERGDCARLLPLRIFFALSPISKLRRGGVRSATWARDAVFFAARAFEVLGTACLLPFPFLVSFTISQDARRWRDVCADVDCICGRRADAMRMHTKLHGTRRIVRTNGPSTSRLSRLATHPAFRRRSGHCLASAPIHDRISTLSSRPRLPRSCPCTVYLLSHFASALPTSLNFLFWKTLTSERVSRSSFFFRLCAFRMCTLDSFRAAPSPPLIFNSYTWLFQYDADYHFFSSR
jgi:hypothetical protein